MAMENDNAGDEAHLRKLVDAWAGAIRNKDLSRTMAHYAPDVVICDLAPPLRRVGRDALEKSLKEWFPTWDGPISFELSDVRITYGGDVAFCCGLNRITGTLKSGEKSDIWVRATICFRKIGNKWKIAHEHTSVPFYMDGSYKAAVDMKP